MQKGHYLSVPLLFFPYPAVPPAFSSHPCPSLLVTPSLLLPSLETQLPSLETLPAGPGKALPQDALSALSDRLQVEDKSKWVGG